MGAVSAHLKSKGYLVFTVGLSPALSVRGITPLPLSHALRRRQASWELRLRRWWPGAMKTCGLFPTFAIMPLPRLRCVLDLAPVGRTGQKLILGTPRNGPLCMSK
jgi:hypothetical protein